MATPEETRAGDGAVAEALQSMTEGDAAPSSRPEHQTRARAPTDSADAASAANAAAPSDASGTLEALAALRVADDAGDESEDAPVVPRAPDVFDRLGYGDSAEVSGGDGPGLGAGDPSGKSDGQSRTRDDHDESDDDEYDDETHPTDDAATLFLDSVVAVADGEIPMDATALGSMANALAREVGVVAEDDNLTLLADAPIAVRVAVRRVSDLALALTLAPPDLARRVPGGALARQPVAGSFRIATLEIVAALVGCAIAEAREAVARCPVRARAPRGRETPAAAAEAGTEAGTSGRDDSEVRPQRHTESCLTPVTAAAAMLFAYEQSTPLQCAAARVLCAALTAAEEPAWAPLLREGWGTAAATEGVVAPPPANPLAEEAERFARQQELSLHARLAAVAEEATRVRPGARRCGVGMAMIVAETLRDAHAEADAFEKGEDDAERESLAAGEEERVYGADRTEPSPNGSNGSNGSGELANVTTNDTGDRDDGWSKAKLRSALRSDARWRAACDDDDGAFRRFERDVRGGLCGPRPSRVASIEEFAFSSGIGSPGGSPLGGVSASGGDLLQVLQRLGGVGVAAQAGPAQ